VPTDSYMFRFLLVSLNIDAILDGTTIGSRRRMLAAITNGLGLEWAYIQTLSEIKGEDGEEARLGIATFRASHSEQSLKATN